MNNSANNHPLVNALRTKIREERAHAPDDVVDDHDEPHPDDEPTGEYCKDCGCAITVGDRFTNQCDACDEQEERARLEREDDDQ